MSKNYVKVSASITLKEANKLMHENLQNCLLVVDEDDSLEGILTYGDIRRCLSKKSSDTSKDDPELDVCRKQLSSFNILETSVSLQFVFETTLF